MKSEFEAGMIVVGMDLVRTVRVRVRVRVRGVDEGEG